MSDRNSLTTNLSGAELERELGLYRGAWDDLGSVLEDYEAVGFVPGAEDALGNVQAHANGEFVLENLGNIIRHPEISRHHNTPHFHAIHKMLVHLYHTLNENKRLHHEKQMWRTPANVVKSVQWDALAAATTSSIATLGAPYSGVNFMIRGMQMIAELCPPGRFTLATFAGINFAQPSAGTIYSTAATVLGTPVAATQGMGFSVFMTNLTGPDHRVWHPWTGLVFSSDAQIFWQWYNADQNNPRSLCFDVTMMSSPCEEYQTGQGHRTWAHEDEGYHSLVDHMFGAIVGLRGAPKQFVTDADFRGQHQHHLPSGGFHIAPGGHKSPMGGGRPGRRE